jgi:hypothetical protein
MLSLVALKGWLVEVQHIQVDAAQVVAPIRPGQEDAPAVVCEVGAQFRLVEQHTGNHPGESFEIIPANRFCLISVRPQVGRPWGLSGREEGLVEGLVDGG